MRILLVRHAEAESGEGIDDAARNLSDYGRATAERVAAALLTQGLVPSAFVASPRLRTQQTAEIFAKVLGFQGRIENMPSLCYTRPAGPAARELGSRTGDVLAFGHMPTLAEISKLLGRGNGLSSFAPSEALMIESGRALWSLDPDSLRIVRR